MKPPAHLRPMRRARALVMGSHVEPIRDLLGDALFELRLEVEVEPRMAPFDLVIAVVARKNLRRVIAEAKLLAGHVPILTIMSIADEECEEMAYQHGASAYWALEWPIGRLAQLVEALLAPRRTPPN